MTTCTCPTCGQPLPADPVEHMTERLQSACRDMGAFITWDNFVSERTAAALLSREASTLRNWRTQHRPLPYRKLHGRVQYQLSDIAKLIISADYVVD